MHKRQIKQLLNDWLIENYEEPNEALNSWKRLSKTETVDGRTIWFYQNTVWLITFSVILDGEDLYIHEYMEIPQKAHNQEQLNTQ